MLRLASSKVISRVVQRVPCAASFSTSTCRLVQSGDDGSNKIYELRTYAIRPDKFGEYLKIMEENIHLRTAHSKLTGFWISDLGGINEVNHIWEYGIFKALLCNDFHENLISHTHVHTHTHTACEHNGTC